METRLYQLSDFEQVNSWGKQWGSTYKPNLFPPVGLIIENVGVYFMYETQSSLVFLESMVVNKDLDTETRHKAADLLLSDMLKLAKDKGYEVAYASTNNPSVVERAIRIGASVTPKYALIQKVL